MGKKVIILGNGGTGKSTLADLLGRSLRLPVTHLDQMTVLPGWKVRPFDEFKRELTGVLQGPEWIVEGWSHHRTLGERLAASDTIIHLDYPIWFAYWSALTRHVRYSFRQNPYDPPNSPIWKKTRLMIKAMWRVYREYEPELRALLSEYSPGRFIYVFHSRGELNRWIRARKWQGVTP